VKSPARREGGREETPLKVVFMGTPAFAVPSLRALIEAFDVAAVVTRPDRPRGRGGRVEPSPVKAVALELGIEVLQPERMKDEDFLRRLGELAPDVVAVVAYGRILPGEVLDLPRLGCVNLHASLLPRYRGASPINHAIINGDAYTGVSTMLMDRGMDTGPVLLAEKVAIGPDETAGELSERLAEIGAPLLRRTIALLGEGEITPRAQDGSLATYAPMLTKADGELDWRLGAEEIKNRVRGLHPWPGTHTHLRGRLIKVHAGRVSETSEAGAGPGEITDVSADGITVRCGRGAFVITELQPENKRRMTAADFIKGYQVKAGESFA